MSNNNNFMKLEYNKKGLYEKVFEAVKNSLNIDTINYKSIDYNPLFKTIIMSLSNDPDITLDNVCNKARVYSVAFLEYRQTILFIHGVKGPIIAPCTIGNKVYIVIFDYMEDIDEPKDLIAQTYVIARNILSFITKSGNIYSSTNYPDLALYSWTTHLKINKEEKYDDNFILSVIAAAVPYLSSAIITYHVLKIGEIISVEDYLEFLFDIAGDGTIERKLATVVVQVCRNYSVAQLLDKGYILLAVKEALNKISPEDVERDIANE